MKKVLGLFAVLSLAFFLTGCATTTFYEARFPVLERPERPMLVDVPAVEMQKMAPKARQDIVENFNSLIEYTKKLEIAVDEYNKFAAEKNKQFKGK
jgi:hypothetical protein